MLGNFLHFGVNFLLLDAPAEQTVQLVNVNDSHPAPTPKEEAAEISEGEASAEVKEEELAPASPILPALDSLITNETDVLLGLFAPKVVKAIRLRFRASEHSFRTELFHHYCDGRPSMMVLALNEQGKVFGGYSPIPFESGVGYEHTRDPSAGTFLFSVSSRLRFPLLLSEKGNALYNDIQWGPSYGKGCDLRIADKADTNRDSYSKFPESFYSPTQRDPAVARYQFIGSVFAQGFRLKEWEVFEVEFER